jgi:hypothetical protein
MTEAVVLAYRLCATAPAPYEFCFLGINKR